VITEEDLAQLSDGGQLDDLIDEAFQNNPKQIEQIKKGKTKVLGYFVGLIMKQTSGKANPKQLNDLIVKKISSLK
jgi:aspartyl-tRNA(Asn)/glutamyl-tRNA(Gln) amidotransferase subunit B